MKRAIAETEAALRRAGAQPLMTLDDAAHAQFWASADDFAALRVGPREALARLNTLPSEAAQALDMASGLASEHGLRLSWLADLATGTLWLRLSAHDEAFADTSANDGAALGGDVIFAAALRATLERSSTAGASSPLSPAHRRSSARSRSGAPTPPAWSSCAKSNDASTLLTASTLAASSRASDPVHAHHGSATFRSTRRPTRCVAWPVRHTFIW